MVVTSYVFVRRVFGDRVYFIWKDISGKERAASAGE